MVLPSPNLAPAPTRTIWGLDPVQLHARFWASLGVQVVRQGEPSEIVPHAELYLLTDPRSLPLFKMSDVMDTLNWVGPQALFIRVHDTRERSYRERVLTDAGDRFVKYQRMYESADRLARVCLTPERELAKLWMNSANPTAGWRRLRHFVRRKERATLSVSGNVFDRTSNEEIARFMHALVRQWKRPDATIKRVKHARLRAASGKDGSVWIDPAARVDPKARLIGNVWVGAGSALNADDVIVGPAVVWDHPEQRPNIEQLEWLNIERSEGAADPRPAKVKSSYRVAKRAFDIVFALLALLITFPIWPVIMLIQWIEDGRPFFFVHRRETWGNREFGCLKFRSMRKNAEALFEDLKDKNRSDGAHVYIENDPRVTRIGRFIRRTNLDELPQFINVLMGDMSIVGPRPSPRKENQFAPAWREARLSVKPGVTGLWQISRTRRVGSDFQEWIKYDIEYVETCSFWLDLKIIYWTIEQILMKPMK
jgi:lipopolysaccharide/colanic/teichoic acid biosynthesis glycosyltransferase